MGPASDFCGKNGCKTLVSSILITDEANGIAGGPTKPVSGELRLPSDGVPVCILPLYPDIDCSSCAESTSASSIPSSGGKAVTEGESREVCATVLAPRIGTAGVPPVGGIVSHDCTPPGGGIFFTYIYTCFFIFFSFIHGLYMCMCIYIYMYVHVCMSVYVCIYLYVSLLMYIFMCECIYMYIHKL